MIISIFFNNKKKFYLILKKLKKKNKTGDKYKVIKNKLEELFKIFDFPRK
jgi:hypothetical protein